MRDSEVLAKAAEEVQDRGWCRYWLMDKEGHVCINGAILVATSPDTSIKSTNRGNAVIGRLGEYMTDVLGIDLTQPDYSYDNPAHWNNQTARDADDVIHMLKLASEHFAIEEEST